MIRRPRALSRRQLLEGGLAAAATTGALLARPSAAAAATKRVTCFYQFGAAALKALAVLPNSENHLHLFTHSHPGSRAHPDAARSVQALGSSFKYGLALDVHKYPGWQTAGDAQLKAWAEEFRGFALDAGGPADYFAFNEMPTVGPTNPELRLQVARWLRHLHTAGGGRNLPGVFYFTERNLNPDLWVGDPAPFWEAIDETCDLVVGEHYHNHGFIYGQSPEKFSTHLFRVADWLAKSGRQPEVRVAREKYAVLLSSYYGPKTTGWWGLLNSEHDPVALEAYFRRVISAVRSSPHGRDRIGFGPLANKDLDPRVHDILARCLADDLRQAA